MTTSYLPLKELSTPNIDNVTQHFILFVMCQNMLCIFVQSFILFMDLRTTHSCLLRDVENLKLSVSHLSIKSDKFVIK